jgi:hypothetical protein
LITYLNVRRSESFNILRFASISANVKLNRTSAGASAPIISSDDCIRPPPDVDRPRTGLDTAAAADAAGEVEYGDVAAWSASTPLASVSCAERRALAWERESPPSEYLWKTACISVWRFHVYQIS